MEKYFEIQLANYDGNNIPYTVGIVHCVALKALSKEEAATFCRDELEMDFEEVLSVEEIPLDEVLEYADVIDDIPRYE